VLKTRRRKLWIGALAVALLLLLLGAIVLSIRLKATAEVAFVPVEAIFRRPRALDQLRIRLNSVFRRGTVMTLVEVFASERLGGVASASALIGKSPAGSDDGIAVWLLEDEEVNAFVSGRGGFREEEIIGKPKMITDEGRIGAFSFEHSATIGATNYDAGLHVRIRAHRAGEKTDLLLGLRDTDFSESPGGGNVITETNAYFALRIQLPPQERAMLVVERKGGKPPLLISVQARFR
jgi:hypothetical protein